MDVGEDFVVKRTRKRRNVTGMPRVGKLKRKAVVGGTGYDMIFLLITLRAHIAVVVVGLNHLL